MLESARILDRFSDSFVAALLDGSNPAEVLSAFEASYPQLSSDLQKQYESLSLLYAHLGKASYPSDAVIAEAYRKLTSIWPSQENPSGSTKGTIPSQNRSRNVYLSLGLLAVGVTSVILWHPWSTSTSELNDLRSPNNVRSSTLVDSTSGAVSTLPTTPEPRASNDHAPDASTSLPQDLSGYHRSLTGQIQQPKHLSVERSSAHSITVKWQPVHGASSYFVEARSDGERHFKPVAQVTRPNARISSLPTGKNVQVRVTAVKGKVKGPSSEVHRIVVP